MGGLSLYGALAPIYDDWQSCDGMIPFAEVVRAKLEPALRQCAGGRPLAFLDAGCGTGTLLCGLRAQHPDWRLAGVDGTDAMLAVAAGKPGSATIAWARAGLEGLPFGARFDAAGCFYDTLNHLTETEALERALAGLAAVLRPGGMLFFDVTNEEGFPRWWRGRPHFAGQRWRMAIEMRFDAARQLGFADVEIARDGCGVQHLALVERLFTRATILGALAAAGLRPVRFEIVSIASSWSILHGAMEISSNNSWTAGRTRRTF
jgi:SAM-dependent methyltransferase